MLTSKIDQLNIALIIISLIVAFIMPFELFLLAYAILGPLHYLTELNWLDQKNYFVSKRNTILILIGLAVLVSIPTILYIPGLNLRETAFFTWLYDHTAEYNTVFFLALASAAALVFAKTRVQQIVSVVLILVGAALVYKNETLWIWFAVLLPTVIHVYVFTFLFMWYGTIKSNSKWGYGAMFMLIAAPVFIMLSDVGTATYGNYFEDLRALSEYGFTSMHQHIGALFDPEATNVQFFGTDLFVKVQVFIAFAYTYHYLNWFSKTTIIGWHKQLTSTRTIIIGLVWILSMVIYWYNYLTGLSVLFLLSILHVFLEFPLNVVSTKGIVQHYTGRSKN